MSSLREHKHCPFSSETGTAAHVLAVSELPLVRENFLAKVQRLATIDKQKHCFINLCLFIAGRQALHLQSRDRNSDPRAGGLRAATCKGEFLGQGGAASNP